MYTNTININLNSIYKLFYCITSLILCNNIINQFGFIYSDKSIVSIYFIYILSILLLIFLGLTGGYLLKEKVFNIKETAPKLNSQSNEKFYQLSAKDIEGNIVNFSKYKGKKLLIVNVASKCGYTPQYKDLQELHKKYNDKITILAFPSNNFGFQEPGSNEQIEEFCETNFGVEFQLFEKSNVRGENTNDVYKWLSSINDNGWNDKSPRWNFFKYLIDDFGNLKAVYSSNVNPLDKEIIDFVLN